LHERRGAIAVCECVIGIYFQGGVDLTNRQRVLAALVINDTEQMQTVEMTGVSLQDVPIRLVRFGQPSSPMER
jgi:hypothetical protein